MSGLFGKSTTINQEDPHVSALRVQTSAQGVPLALVYGTTRVTPNLIDYFDFTSIAHTQTQESGGKGGGGVTTNSTTYTYTVGVIFGIMQGVARGGVETDDFILQVWASKDKKTPVAIGLSQFNGNYGQAPFGFLSTNHPERALGYRGIAYAAQAALDLGSSPSLANYSFEVTGLLVPECQNDITPGAISYDFLTSVDYGCQFQSVDTPSFNDWIQYCHTQNLRASPAYKAQRPAKDMLTEMCLLGNAAPFWSAGLIKVKPYCDANISGNCEGPLAYAPDLTVCANFTMSDFITAPGEPPVRSTRKTPADCFNHVSIQCLERANDYNTVVVESKDDDSILRFGLRSKPMITAEAICDPEVAQNLCQLLLNRELYIRNRHAWTGGWRFARLEPMDIVTLTEPFMRMDHLKVRILSVTENADGDFAFEAEDLVVGSTQTGAIDSQGSQGTVINNDVTGGNTTPPVIFQPPVELSGLPEIWIGAAGGSNWGGANIWVSEDGSSYAQVGVITSAARYGVLSANFPSHTSPDTVNTLSVNLTVSQGNLVTASNAQADAGDTLSYVGTQTEGELIAYSTANMTSPFHFALTDYITRGQRCTVPTAHAANQSFMRLDGAVAKISITESRVGQTLSIKLPSFNKYGGGLQALTGVPVFTYVVQPLGVVAINGAVPDVIPAGRILCIAPGSQYTVQGRITILGRVNDDGRLIII